MRANKSVKLSKSVINAKTFKSFTTINAAIKAASDDGLYNVLVPVEFNKKIKKILNKQHFMVYYEGNNFCISWFHLSSFPYNSSIGVSEAKIAARRSDAVCLDKFIAVDDSIKKVIKEIAKSGKRMVTYNLDILNIDHRVPDLVISELISEGYKVAATYDYNLESASLIKKIIIAW